MSETNWNELRDLVYQTAVGHGWHEHERPIEEIICLCHCELSEAVEELRSGNPDIWHKCNAPLELGCVCELGDMCGKCKAEVCAMEYQDAKPEGVAIEITDCAIRILDYMGSVGANVKPLLYENEEQQYQSTSSLLAHICICHEMLSIASSFAREQGITFLINSSLNRALELCRRMVADMGFDMEKLIRLKNEYNRTREYRHGKKF